MILYLSSDKLGNRVDYLHEWIRNNDNKILLIPNSRDAKEDKEQERERLQKNISMLEEVGFSVEILDLKNYFDDYNKLLDKLKDYQAFCIMGGNAFVLRKAMQKSGFDKYLLNNQNKNILYFGYSAGCCCLGKTLKGIELVDEAINPYDNEDVLFDGIGLLDYLIVPHYKTDNRMDKVVDYLNENNINYKTLSDGDVIIEKR